MKLYRNCHQHHVLFHQITNAKHSHEIYIYCLSSTKVCDEEKFFLVAAYFRILRSAKKSLIAVNFPMAIYIILKPRDCGDGAERRKKSSCQGIITRNYTTIH